MTEENTRHFHHTCHVLYNISSLRQFSVTTILFLWKEGYGKPKISMETQTHWPRKKERKITHASTLQLEMNVRNLSYYTNSITYPMCMQLNDQPEVIFRLVGLQGFLPPKLQSE